MKIKTTLTLTIASLTVLFTACASTTTTTTNTANKSNTAVVVNSNQTAAANNTAPATNTAANSAANANKGASTKNDGKIKGEYTVGEVKCTITPDEKDSDLYAKVQCADRPKAESYTRDDDPSKKQAILVSSENEKRRFVFPTDNSASGTFTDEKGKTVKVTRVQ